MKEHALFLLAGFPCKDSAWIKKADFFRQQFENLLRQAVEISSGRISRCVLSSGELTTEFTIPAEKKTSQLSGVPIDSCITAQEQQLKPWCRGNWNREDIQRVRQLNQRALFLLDGLIEFKENILREVGQCRLFTANYPLLVKHILREAKLYRCTIRELSQNKKVSFKNLRNQEDFWNQIMMEHALFIRGLLDPCEEELIKTADSFAMDYKKLLEMAKTQDCRASESLKEQSLKETQKYREFKASAAQGLLACKIDSIILPLLADHVLREANHYLRILECGHMLREE